MESLAVMSIFKINKLLYTTALKCISLECTDFDFIIYNIKTFQYVF